MIVSSCVFSSMSSARRTTKPRVCMLFACIYLCEIKYREKKRKKRDNRILNAINLARFVLSVKRGLMSLEEEEEKNEADDVVGLKEK